MFPGETILNGKDGQEAAAAVKKRDAHYSEFQVLKSAAGWYIGTIFTACDKEKCGHNCAEDYDYLKPEERRGCREPGSRETGYFEKKMEAEQALETFKATGVLARIREA